VDFESQTLPLNCHLKSFGLHVQSKDDSHSIKEIKRDVPKNTWTLIALSIEAVLFINLAGKCEKDTHLSKLKEWTQRQVEYSERDTVMTVLQDGVSSEPETPRAVTMDILSLACRSLPWCSLNECYTVLPDVTLSFIISYWVI
jgi:hypothetical protein